MESLVTIIAAFSWELAFRNFLHNDQTKCRWLYVLIGAGSLVLVSFATVNMDTLRALLLIIPGILAGFVTSKHINLP